MILHDALLHTKNIHSWIELGLFKTLCHILTCDVVSRETFQILEKIFITILKLPSFNTFFDELTNYMDPNANYVPLIYMMYNIMKENPKIVEMFIEQSGTNFLLDFYQKNLASQTTRKRTYARQNKSYKDQIATHFQEDNPLSPKIQSFQRSRTFTTSGGYSPSNFRLSMNKKGQRKGSFVPSLTLPVTPGREPRSFSRLSRRTGIFDDEILNFNIGLDTVRTDPNESKKPMNEIFKGLGKKLGETFIMNDFSTLLSIKRELERDGDIFCNDDDDEQDTSFSTPKQNLMDIDWIINYPKDRNVRKWSILLVLNLIYSVPFARKYFRNPVNFFMVELNSLREYNEVMKSPTSTTSLEKNIMDVMYKIMSQFAGDAEIHYFSLWKKATKSNEIAFKNEDVSKYDLFLWRWSAFAENSVSECNFIQINNQLQILSNYMKLNTSRVSISQCSLVCVSSLVKIMDLCRDKLVSLLPNNDELNEGGGTKIKYSYKNSECVLTIHLLLELFDLLMNSPENHPLNLEFYYFLFIDNEIIHHWIQGYTQHLFSLKEPTENSLSISLKEQREKIILHFKSLMKLMDNLREEFLDQEAKKKMEIEHSEDSYAKADYIKNNVMLKFEFLVNPIDGIILRFLANESIDLIYYSVKKIMLQFLEKLFSIHNISFLSVENYCNSYTRYHFQSFMKLYVSPKTDKKTIELSILHLKILRVFSQNKTQILDDVLFKMKIVDFLAKEISLESKYPPSLKKKDVKNNDNDNNSDYNSDYSDYSDTDSDDIPLDSPREKPKFGLSLNFSGANAGWGNDELAKESMQASDEIDPFSRKNSLVNMDDLASPKKKISLKDFGNKLKLSLGNNEKMKVPQLKVTPEVKEDDSEKSNSDTDTDSDIPLDSPSKPSGMKIPGLSLGGNSKSGGMKMPGLSLGGSSNSNIQGSAKDDSNKSNSDTDTDSDTPLDSPSKPSGMKIPGLSLGGNKPSGMKMPRLNMQKSEHSKDASDKSNSDTDSDTPLDSPSKPSGMKMPGLNLGGNSKSGGMKLPPMKNKDITEEEEEEEEEDPTNVPSISKIPINDDSDDDHTNIASPSRVKVPTMAMGFKLNMTNVVAIDDNQFELGPVKTTYKPPISPGEVEKKVEFQLSPTLDSPNNYSPGTGRESENDDEKKYFREHKEALTQRNIFINRNEMKEKEEELDNETLYFQEIEMRKMYFDSDLHIEMIALLMTLLITPKDTLDQKYTDDYPVQRGMLNIPHYLHHHINHPDNQDIIPKLHSEIVKIGRGARILFRLVCKKMFQTNIYSNKIKRIGVGGFGTVWQCKLPFSHSNLDTVAAKMVEVPKDVHSRCVVHDVFTEILVMDLFKGDPRICRMYDYGVDDDQYYIIMKEYRTSLRTWREKQTTPLSQLLPLYMRIFYKVLESIKFLCDHNVNHFDLKCDNVFLEPFEGVSDKDFWKNTAEDPNFKLVLGDFGTAHLFATETDAYTTRNRGTDCIKSPEMLKIELLKTTNKNYDRRKRVGANSASDMWSLGCLFFELLTTEYLFNTPNFFLVVTNDKFKLISQERYQMLGYNPILMDILTFILVRDPERRPNIEDIISRFRYYMTLVPLYEEMKKKGKFQGINSPKVTARIEFKDIEQVKQNDIIKLDNEENEKNEILLTPVTAKVKIDGINGDNIIPYFWSKEDTEYCEYHYSEIIKSKLYLSGDSVALDKKMLDKLGITHIVICSDNKSPYKKCFFYYEFNSNTSELPNDKNAFIEYEDAFSFVRTAIATKGKVLVYSGKGLSRSALFVISYLLHTYNLSSYEAYLYVHNLRPAIRPEILYSFLNYLNDAKFIQKPIHDYESMLNTNEKVKKWVSRVNGGIDTKKFNIRKAIQWYRCLCGACLIGLISPYHHGSTVSKMGYSLVNILKDLWPSFLEEMKAVYFYEASSVKFAITTKDRCFLDEFGLKENCEKYVRKTSAKKKFTNSEWVLYRCKHCQWATHAIREKSKGNTKSEKPSRDLPQLDEVDVAVVSNLLTNLHYTIEDKVEDARPASLLSHF